MEFPISATESDSISFLDKDDISGPGHANYIKRTGDRSVDYALFKISTYSTSTESLERLKFVRDLEELTLLLGPTSIPTLSHVLQTLVT